MPLRLTTSSSLRSSTTTSASVASYRPARWGLRRSPMLPLAASVAALLPLAVAGESRAQTAQPQPAQQGEFSAQRFEPAAGAGNILSVEGARMAGNMGWSAGLLFNYAYNPLVVRSCVSQTNCSEPNSTTTDTPVVQSLVTWDLLGSFSPLPWLQIGARLPLVYADGAGLDLNTGGPSQQGLSAFSVGDPNIEAKFRIPFSNSGDTFVLGVAGDVTFPVAQFVTGTAGTPIDPNATKDPRTGIGSSSVTGGLRVIADAKFGPVQVVANVRGVIREDATYASTTVGPEMRYGVGVGYQATPIVRVLAEGFGATRFEARNGSNSLETLAAVQIAPADLGLVITAGGGAGVVQGAGVPVARGLVGLTYSREDTDSDGDGVGDRNDQCKTIKEDPDGFEDQDGCPEDDNDRDKVVDANDKCPTEPETVNGVQDDDGCPDTLPDRDGDSIQDSDDKCPDAAGKSKLTDDVKGCPDNDDDKIPDAIPEGMDPARRDLCPTEKEDFDGFLDQDGCPELDNDQDGIPDETDECGEDPETKNGIKDEDGCPENDTDKDGIVDEVDKCPKQPENLNGVQDEDGCPDLGSSLVEIQADEIKILQRVEFATSKDTITGNASFKVLDAVVSALRSHPEVYLVEVGGHTDNLGDRNGNVTLSQKRADAVVKYLVDKGIDSKRLVAKGYGPDKPIADNKNKDGQQKNRRVEFQILRSKAKPGIVVAQPAAQPAQPAPAQPAPTPAPPQPAPTPAPAPSPPPAQPAPPPAKPAPAPSPPPAQPAPPPAQPAPAPSPPSAQPAPPPAPPPAKPAPSGPAPAKPPPAEPGEIPPEL